MNYQTVIDFWFLEMDGQWFKKDSAVDQTITERFMKYYLAAKDGLLFEWQQSPQGLLALVLLLDQFSRNMFRGQAQMYTTDAQALQLCKKALELNYSPQLTQQQRLFLYMPLMHSEALDDQELCIKLFKQENFPSLQLDFAVQHRDIIQRFGRFPHRNTMLQRQSTPEEIEFLSQPNSSF